MTQPPPATVGMGVDEIDTPALIVDLDAFERNLQTMADRIAGSPARLRPHAKTHKSPVIACKQIELGAVGICCQKVSEAEIMVQGGVTNVLVSNEVVGRHKLERLAALARDAEVGFCIDAAEIVAEADAAAAKFGVVLDTLVEIDVGAGRCGIAPGAPALELAQRIDAAPHLRFAGLQAYHGSAQHIRAHADRTAAIEAAIAATRETVEALAGAGLACDIVGGAGTGTFEIEAASGVYTELQAGSYIFMDADYARNEGPGGGAFDTFEHALFVLAGVMSRPGETRAVVDAGHKALSVDSGMPVPHGIEPATYHSPSDEHGVLDLTGCNAPPALGDTVLIVPGHCDPTVNLHDWFVCVRGLSTDAAHVEALWPVAARGALF